MTQNYLTGITPDNISGILFALEGIKNVVTLLNGPTGCKYYHSSYSDRLYPRRSNPGFLAAGDEWYFNQPRVPCTYLDRKDYVYGSREKLLEGLSFLQEHTPFDLLCVVNSPGAALIGDDLEGILRPVIGDKPLVTVQTPGYSGDVFQGYERGVLSLLQQLRSMQKEETPEPRTVNLLGLSIYQYYHDGDLAEMRRMLALCGIKVHCSLCCNSSLEEILSLKKASLNIVLRPEYGAQTAQYLERELGIPYYICDTAPIGFMAAESMMQDICTMLSCDSSALIEESHKARAVAYCHISRLNTLSGLPRGVTYSLVGTTSETCGYIDFLSGYLGMALTSCTLLGTPYQASRDALTHILNSWHCADAPKTDLLANPGEVVLADGNTIARLKLSGHRFTGIENAEPGIGYVHVIPKTHIGINGALYLLEQVLNALDFA